MTRIGPGAPPPRPQEQPNIREPRTGQPMGLPQDLMQMPRSEAAQQLAQLNGILEFAGLGNLGGDVEPVPVQRGDAREAPNTGGEVRNRGQDVKDFFKSVGKGISSFFKSVGKAIASGAEKVADFFKARFQRADPPLVTEQEKRDLRKDALKQMSAQFEAGFQAEIRKPGQENLTRAEFAQQKMPVPEGGVEGLNTESPLYVGDMFAGGERVVFSGMGTPEQTEMYLAIMDRLEEFPSLEIAVESLMGKEMECLDSQPDTFIRGNSAYSKTEKLFCRSAVPLKSVSEDILTNQKDYIEEKSDLAEIDGVRIAMTSINQEQADALFTIADGILDNLLSVDPTDTESFANSVPEEFQAFVREQADQILGNEDLSQAQKQDAIDMLYSNAFFLRSSLGELIGAATRTFEPGSNETILAVKSMQVVQTFLNGVTDYSIKGNELAQTGLDGLWEKHGDRLDAFLAAVGKPTVEE